MKVTLLGSGASSGVPLIGCDCPVCLSPNPRNKRTRVSLMVETLGKQILIDTSPDLRQQFLREGLKTADAILYTHAHADHIHGIDDIRSLNFHRGGPIPAYANRATLDELHERFGYVFKEPPKISSGFVTEQGEARSGLGSVSDGGVSPPQKNTYGWFRPCLTPYEITPGMAFEVEGVRITPFRQIHGKVDSLGFRIGKMAYSTDVKAFPPESEEYLHGLDLWILDCLKPEPAPTHTHLAQSLEWVARFKPKRTILTHLAHEFDYDTLQAQCPPDVEPGYDGLSVEIAA
jgi:phosphoribosyl 1,2-cyclic phosphate phosphodiesterase